MKKDLPIKITILIILICGIIITNLVNRYIDNDLSTISYVTTETTVPVETIYDKNNISQEKPKTIITEGIAPSYSESDDTNYSSEYAISDTPNTKLSQYDTYIYDVNSLTYDDFMDRFVKVDAQISKLKQDNKDTSGIGLKNIASTELKYWEIQLASLINAINSGLTEEKSTLLAKEEQEWLKNRDIIATNISLKFSGGTLESISYIESQADSDRLRAYELLERYKNIFLTTTN